MSLLYGTEYGLQVAINSTDVLYHNKATALLELSPDQLENMFNGLVAKLPLHPGLTVHEAAMLAGCFTSESASH